MPGTAELFIGLMSGTSLDGVDAALVDLAPAIPRICTTAYLPYPEHLRAEALALHAPLPDELHRAALFSQRLAHLYAEAVHHILAQSGIAAADIRAIGCHGQTVRHRPDQGYSLQLNQPALLAELTGICVVVDFRSRDIAAGGQGAPLVPAFHAGAFAHPHQHRVILNLGGIANLTDLAPDHLPCGFDCGPGNMLLDAWIQQQRGLPYDTQGAWAAQGQVLPELLDRLYTHPFFSAAPPKSCGREEFHLAWLTSHLSGHEAAEDVQATLLMLTCRAICDALAQECHDATELYLCGGGAHNTTLRDTLARLLPHIHIMTTDALGIPADCVEAVAFAWLAWRTLQGQPGNLPEVTGALGPRLLGAIYPA